MSRSVQTREARNLVIPTITRRYLTGCECNTVVRGGGGPVSQDPGGMPVDDAEGALRRRGGIGHLSGRCPTRVRIE